MQAAMFPDSNVKLERLDSTKVAVAQFAENNFPPNDLAMLLYSLQQQQLMQLQLLQQLQSQLAAGITPSLHNLPAMLLPGASALLAPMTAAGSPMLANIAPSHMVSPPTNGVASVNTSDTPAIYSHSNNNMKTNSKSVITSVTSSNNNNELSEKMSPEQSDGMYHCISYLSVSLSPLLSLSLSLSLTFSHRDLSLSHSYIHTHITHTHPYTHIQTLIHSFIY